MEYIPIISIGSKSKQRQFEHFISEHVLFQRVAIFGEIKYIEKKAIGSACCLVELYLCKGIIHFTTLASQIE
jgi:hypothetical protein